MPCGWAPTNLGCRSRLSDPVSPNAHKAVIERTDRSTVPILRVWWAWGFHLGRAERRLRSRDVACGLALERTMDGLARAEVRTPPRLHRGGFTTIKKVIDG